MKTRVFWTSLLTIVVAGLLFAEDGGRSAAVPEFLPKTQLLTTQGDIASEMVAGIDRFLLGELEKSVERRAHHWRRDFSSPEAYTRSIEPNRQRLARIIGLRDERVPFDAMELVGTTAQSALVGEGESYRVFAVRWPAFGDVHGEGLLLIPKDGEPIAHIIAVPDADQTPESLVGLAEGVLPESQYARRLAESGCRVVVPILIDRRLEKRQSPEGGSSATLTNREYLYRPAFELGRHLIGYEVQKVLAVVDWFAKDAPDEAPRVGVIGWGEGGLLALYSAALDVRIDAACVSGYFTSRQNIWEEPLDRNVFGLLEQFGDAELAGMISPRPLIVEAATAPELVLPGLGGAPGKLVTPALDDVRREVERARQLVAGLDPAPRIELIVSGDGAGPYGTDEALQRLLDSLSPGARLAASSHPPKSLRKDFDPTARRHRQMHEIDRHNQWLLSESPYVRTGFFKNLDTSSLDNYSKTVEVYRDYFRREIIGEFEYELRPINPRSRKACENAKWIGYEVVVDVFPDVIAYGILLLPNDLREDERRPVVVCQHGLEGRPQNLVQGNHRAYHDFAARLAEQGFIVFAPQNPYIFGDRFRTLQRKANPIKTSLFSVIVAQHQQILHWLKTLPHVDPKRIAFYGLSYGGKTAMRVPALLDGYCLSICSADFNDWVWKNASTRSRCSYVWTGEYEIFEFDLGSTFNYAEMAALIAGRPFMVERGHFDGVAPDERVAYEFAKVRHLYAGRLKLPDRCEIEFFDGGHEIHAQRTFDFLRKHLAWPPPDGAK